MPPTASYLIAASQRSGSTMLCRALADTGVAGRPEEYFLCGPPEAFPPGWEFWERGIFAEPHGEMDREGYLALVHRIGTSSNGVFGAKVMWNYVPWILDELGALPRFEGVGRADVFRELFPDLGGIVVLHRRDRVRQAVSWARAAQDGVWVVSDSEPAAPAMTPEYSFEFIDALVGLLGDAADGWAGFCDEMGITPLHVAYEDLAAPVHYERVIADVLTYLGLDRPTVGAPPPRTHRQTDDLNDGWVERYLADARRR